MRSEEKDGKKGSVLETLRVVLTPLTSAECRVYVDRLQRRKAATRDVECERCAERVRERKEEAKRRKRERNREWKKANREKVREQKRKWRENNPEKVKAQRKRGRAREKARLEGDEERLRKAKEKAREQKQRYRQANPEKVREQERKRQQANREKLRERKQRWRENNPEKVKAQRKRERAREKARLEADEERMRVVKEKAREQKRRYREANREKLREQKRRWRRANPEKFKAQRERSREADKAQWRLYHEAHKEEHNQARRERYARQKGRPVPLPLPPPCDCGMCLTCGGWGASWKPAWHARLNAFSAKKDPLPASLEELPLELLESEAETLSIASTSEIDSELGDRLDALLADESDSEVETVDKVEAPTRRSDRIATMPAVSYQDWEEENPMLEFLKRKAQLHAEGEDRIVTRWELLSQRTERVDAIVEEMSMGVDSRRELDRFHSQLERQDCVLDVMVSEELLDFVDDQLWEPFGETMNV